MRRIHHEVLNRVITNFNVRVAMSVLQPSSLDRAHYKLLSLDKLVVNEEKTYTPVRQAYKKYRKAFLSMQNAILSKIETPFWITL